MNETIYDLTEAAVRLRASKSFIRKEVEKGNLKCFRIGNRIRITEEDINNYINDLRGE